MEWRKVGERVMVRGSVGMRRREKARAGERRREEAREGESRREKARAGERREEQGLVPHIASLAHKRGHIWCALMAARRSPRAAQRNGAQP